LGAGPGYQKAGVDKDYRGNNPKRFSSVPVPARPAGMPVLQLADHREGDRSPDQLAWQEAKFQQRKSLA